MPETPFEDWVGDYESSFASNRLPAATREHLGSVLQAFLAAVRRQAPDFPDTVPSPAFAQALDHVLALDLPAAARTGAAEAIAGFFEFLQGAGRLAEGEEWAARLRILGARAAERVRADGSVRGVTSRRPSAAIGRNDPCPCGSGKKYKKCCGG